LIDHTTPTKEFTTTRGPQAQTVPPRPIVRLIEQSIDRLIEQSIDRSIHG
jgi:hypothetical protein